MANRAAVAHYAAKIIAGNNESERRKLLLQLSAWLKISSKTSDADYLANDIALELAKNSYYFIIITSARQLSQSAKNTIMSYLKSHYGNSAEIELLEVIDSSIIGGIVISTPDGVLDASVKHRLMQLVKGANEV